MTDIATLLAAPGLQSTAFPPSSRYNGIGLATLALPNGEVRIYLKRRFAPQPGELTLVRRHTVASGERADTIAARELGDPTQMWRLSDANRLDARQLTAVPGRILDVALPGAGGSKAGA